MKNKKYIMILLIFIILCVSNIVLAENEKSGEYGDKWDDFLAYFKEKINNNQATDLTDDEIQRMIDGPKMEDFQDGSLNTDPSAIASVQEEALRIQNTRNPVVEGPNNGPQTGTSSKTGEEKQYETGKSGDYGNKWDDFYDHFFGMIAKKETAQLTNEEIERMIAGPTKEEYQDGSQKTDVRDYAFLKEVAINLKATRINGGQGLADQETLQLQKSELKKIYDLFQNAKTDEDKKKYAKDFQAKLQEMKGMGCNDVLYDGEVTSWNIDVALKLQELGETPLNIYEGQVTDERRRGDTKQKRQNFQMATISPK